MNEVREYTQAQADARRKVARYATWAIENRRIDIAAPYNLIAIPPAAESHRATIAGMRVFTMAKSASVKAKVAQLVDEGYAVALYVDDGTNRCMFVYEGTKAVPFVRKGDKIYRKIAK